MPQYLTLTSEQKERVRLFLREGAPVSTLETNVELHYAAKNWNWDDGHKELLEIIKRPDCSIATALLIYWNGEAPEIFFNCENPEDSKKIFYTEDIYNLLITIETKILQHQYEHYNIGFDPKNYNGIDLTKGWDNPKAKHHIPIELTKAVEGLTEDPNIFF